MQLILDMVAAGLVLSNPTPFMNASTASNAVRQFQKGFSARGRMIAFRSGQKAAFFRDSSKVLQQPSSQP